MSDPSHVDVLRAGPRVWNSWRRENPGVLPVLNDLNVSISERQFGRAQGGPIDLSLAELRRALLDQATLTEANMAGAILVDADLSDARLENADLRGANLSGASLAYATLSGARLEGADLCGVDLRVAQGLTQAQIDQALGDHRTVLPANLTKPRAWLQREGASQLVPQGDAVTSDETADPYEVLGVRPGASMRDIRAAWLRLVRELHFVLPAGGPRVSERLKTINRAYQTLRDQERQVARRLAAPGVTRRKAQAIFAVFFLISAVVGTAIAAAWLYIERPDVAPGEAILSRDVGSQQGDGLPPNVQPTPPARLPAEEPIAGADARLR